MLTSEWKRIVLSLRLLGVGLLLGALAAALPFVLTGRDELRILGLVGLGASLLSTSAVVTFATMPRDANARGPAIIAAAFFVGEFLCRLAPTAVPGPAAMVLVLAPLFALIGLLAHLKALGQVGLYLRDDKIYERASSLSVLLFLVIAGSLVAAIVSCLMPTAGMVVTLVLTVVAVAIPIAYVILVFRTASSMRALLP